VKYLLRVFDSGGQVQTVCIEGDTPAGASAAASARGWKVIAIRAGSARSRNRVGRTVLGAAKFNIELFARELAALLDAGVSVIDALRTLGSNERREASAAVYRDLLRRLEEGTRYPRRWTWRTTSSRPYWWPASRPVSRPGGWPTA